MCVNAADAFGMYYVLFRDICEAYQGIELQLESSLDAVYEHLNSMNSTNAQLPI